MFIKKIERSIQAIITGRYIQANPPKDMGISEEGGNRVKTALLELGNINIPSINSIKCTNKCYI